MLWTDHACGATVPADRGIEETAGRLRGGAQGSDGHTGEPAGLHQEIRLERPAHYVPEDKPTGTHCASPATTMSATRLWAIGGRKLSKNSNPTSRSSTTCRRRPSPFPVCISTWPTSASTHEPSFYDSLGHLRLRATSPSDFRFSPVHTTTSGGRTTCDHRQQGQSHHQDHDEAARRSVRFGARRRLGRNDLASRAQPRP